MLFFTVLLLATLVTTDTLECHKVPLPDGTFQLMSDEEINETLTEEDANPQYNAYDDIVFHLYTNSNPCESTVIQIDNVTSLHASNFDPSLPTVVLVHGWLWNHTLFFVQDSKDEYLKKGPYNVIATDWSKGGGIDKYVLVRSRVYSTGIVIGKFIEFLQVNGVTLNDVIVVGYSVGAHVVGNAGKHLNGKLPVIFALDPAGPLFRPMDFDRIKASDAGYVEVIHTSTLWGNGDVTPSGDADFYPNGGGTQPGCNLRPSCSHDRAPYYFIESINGDVKFIGKKCITFGSMAPGGCLFQRGAMKVMGGEPYTPGSGIYYVPVNSESPFAKG